MCKVVITDDDPQDFESKIFWSLYRDGFGQHSGRRFKHLDSEDKAHAGQACSLARRFREAFHSITRHGGPNEEILQLYITMDKVQDIEKSEIQLRLSNGTPQLGPFIVVFGLFTTVSPSLGKPVEMPYRVCPEGESKYPS